MKEQDVNRPMLGINDRLLNCVRAVWKPAFRRLLALCLALIALGFPFSAAAATVTAPVSFSTNRPLLTLSALEQRIASPERQGGSRFIDLSGFTIDLRPVAVGGQAGDGFVDKFYQRLQKGLNAVQKGAQKGGQTGAQPLGLNLSNDLIQGDLDLARLSFRVPAYGEVSLPALDAFNQAFQPSVALPGGVAQSLLIQPQASALDTFVFQGPLLLRQTCFNGQWQAANLYLLGRVEADLAIFTQLADWRSARFGSSVSFSQSQFQQESSFRSALFSDRARFDLANFAGATAWQGATFKGNTSFAQAEFHEANFARSHWQTNADFDLVHFRSPANFQKSRFDRALFLSEAQFDGAVNFRQAQFQAPLSLRGARILSQLDFGDARFAEGATINVADLDFNAGEAKILGSPGQIGRVFSVPGLSNNETVLRNLVRNFRLLEQVADANQLEYTTERLRLAQIKRQVFGVSLNQASRADLIALGLSEPQVMALKTRIEKQPLVSRADLLSIDEIDMATYLRVRDRVTVRPATLLSRAQWLVRWLLLAGLLLCSDYGTNVSLVFSVGLVITTVFGLLFWVVDRYRWRLASGMASGLASELASELASAAQPDRPEVLSMLLGAAGLLAFALGVLSQSSVYPLLTLAAIALVSLPIPIALLVWRYRQSLRGDAYEGQQALLETSYFVKNGALRTMQVLIARLPIIPKYPFYRDRYLPLLMDRRWSWLEYYDFSLNNCFRFGFNDIRLRDKAVPGLVSTLVWYQWCLGVAFVAMLLWTLSRTIPGLNLLLYF
jgi:hypothetical protein